MKLRGWFARLRDRIVDRLLAGCHEGEYLPWWGLLVMWTAHPSLPAVWLLSRALSKTCYYDAMRDLYVLDGVKLSGRYVRSMASGPLPSGWHRFIRRENGTVTVERVFDAAELSNEIRWVKVGGEGVGDGPR